MTGTARSFFRQGTASPNTEVSHGVVGLVLAGLLEVGWAIGLKYTEGFTRLWPTVGTVGSMVISIALLGIAMKSLPVGTAYAIWVGVGAVGTAILASSCSATPPMFGGCSASY